MLSHLKTLVKHATIRWLLWREKLNGHADPFADLPPSAWGFGLTADGHLRIDDVDVVDLVRAYGTPLHVVSKRRLLETYSSFLESFRAVYPNTVLATSYKTNPVPGVIAALHEAGSHAEVISHLELWLALELGMPPERIIFNGPGKTTDALQLAVDRGIGMINIDGFAEIPLIGQLARNAGRKQKVGLRVTTSVGWSSQFGLNIANGDAMTAFRQMVETPGLVPCGLHLHLGTGIHDVGTYVRAVRELIAFSRQLEQSLRITIDTFDLGGGFGVPTVRTMSPWDVRMMALGYPSRRPDPTSAPKPADYASALAPLLKELADRGTPRVVLEPGRAITSGSQVLLLSVLTTKHGSKGVPYIITDGGKNITMPLGWETHQIYVANKLNVPDRMKCHLFGPLCHPGDILANNVVLPRIVPGDVLAIMDAGAYFIPNQMNFSNPRPPIVMIENAKETLLRRRETFSDVFRLDSIVPTHHAAA